MSVNIEKYHIMEYLDIWKREGSSRTELNKIGRLYFI